MALLVSSLIHLGVLFGGVIDLRPRPDLQRLDALMVRAAPDVKLGEAPKSVKKPKPSVKKKKPPPVPKPPVVEKEKPSPELKPEPPPEPQPEPEQVAEPQQEVSPQPPEPATSGGSFWPKAGRITFAVLMGEGRFRAGWLVHEWRVTQDKQYEIYAVIKSAEVAEMPSFRIDETMHVSKGRITEKGFQPDFFIEQVAYKGVRARVDFDRVNLVAGVGGETVPIEGRIQDVLSVYYQLGYPGVIESGALPVHSGTQLDTYQFELLGEEPVALSGETWRTYRIRATFGAGKSLEIWIAPDHFGLPMQIRTVDGKGVVYYMVAMEIAVSKDSVDTSADTPRE